mmetsp:Transcript_13762/g.35531  ORF Transcript_13762/g.35531 Transcript_13762/m.35531 type:complete len:291 (-) Transcript_13762:158-1030(-)
MTPRSLGKRHCRTISRDDLDFPTHAHSAVEDATLHVRRQESPRSSSSLSRYFLKAKSFSCLDQALGGPWGESAKSLEKRPRRPKKKRRQTVPKATNSDDSSTASPSHEMTDGCDMPDCQMGMATTTASNHQTFSSGGGNVTEMSPATSNGMSEGEEHNSAAAHLLFPPTSGTLNRPERGNSSASATEEQPQGLNLNLNRSSKNLSHSVAQSHPSQGDGGHGSPPPTRGVCIRWSEAVLSEQAAVEANHHRRKRVGKSVSPTGEGEQASYEDLCKSFDSCLSQIENAAIAR